MELILKNKELYFTLQKSIAQCDGLDEVMRSLNQVNKDQKNILKSTERKFRCVMLIKKVLESVQQLLELLKSSDCSLLFSIHQV